MGVSTLFAVGRIRQPRLCQDEDTFRVDEVKAILIPSRGD